MFIFGGRSGRNRFVYLLLSLNFTNLWNLVVFFVYLSTIVVILLRFLYFVGWVIFGCLTPVSMSLLTASVVWHGYSSFSFLFYFWHLTLSRYHKVHISLISLEKTSSWSLYKVFSLHTLLCGFIYCQKLIDQKFGKPKWFPPKYPEMILTDSWSISRMRTAYLTMPNIVMMRWMHSSG